MAAADPESLQSRSPITHSKVLVVEGNDAFQFFKALLRDLDLLTQVEIRNARSVDELPKYLGTLPVTPGFAGVTSLGVVRDAETNATFAFESVCGGLQRANLSVPRQPMAFSEGSPKTFVFILPDCVNPGMLETLCWQAVSHEPAALCVEEYFACLERQHVTLPTNVPKARLHAFLASRPKSDLLLGQAAHAGYLQLQSPAFDQVKQFLQAL
jgi:hypothetical protein